MSKKAKIIIGYWKTRALAHPIRALLYYLNLDFTEEIYERGPEPDYSPECWYKVKHSLSLPFPNLPYLKHDGLLLTETNAILKFLCAKYMPNLLGKNPEEKGQVRMLDNIISDANNAQINTSYFSNEKLDTFMTIEKHFICLENWIATGNKFLLGTKDKDICYVDFILWEAVNRIMWWYDSFAYIYNKKFEFSNLLNIWQSIEELPGIRSFKQTESFNYQFNNKYALYNN